MQIGRKMPLKCGFFCDTIAKSTLLSLACGLLAPEAGNILLAGNRPSPTAGKTVRNFPEKVPVGYMFQKDHLFEWRSLYRNVMLGPELQRNQKDRDVIRSVEQMIDFYGLHDFTESPPSALSGGMRQRAALIRTLAVNPLLLLLDEPFSALDYQTRLEVADDIVTLIRKSKKTVLMVTHDLSEAVSVADRILVLSRRPCFLKADIPITFPEGVTRPGLRRSRPEFSEFYNLVWKELKEP